MGTSPISIRKCRFTCGRKTIHAQPGGLGQERASSLPPGRRDLVLGVACGTLAIRARSGAPRQVDEQLFNNREAPW